MATAARTPAKPTTTAVATRKPTAGAVVTWKEKLAAAAKKHVEQEASTATGSFITLPAGILTFQGNAMPNNEMTCVVIDSILENNFYEGAYDAKNPQNPVCFALGRDESEMVAHEKSTYPQGAENGACQGCEHNEWGTAVNAKGEPTRGKACQQRRRLMLIPEDCLKKGPEGVAKAQVAFFKLSVTSVKNWAAYVNSLAARYSAPPFAFVTKIKVVRDARTQHQTQFTAEGEIENTDMLDAIEKKIEKHQDDLFRSYEERDGGEAKPAQKAAAAPKKRKY
jgi:hypothetical protein